MSALTAASAVRSMDSSLHAVATTAAAASAFADFAALSAKTRRAFATFAIFASRLSRFNVVRLPPRAMCDLLTRRRLRCRETIVGESSQPLGAVEPPIVGRSCLLRFVKLPSFFRSVVLPLS